MEYNVYLVRPTIQLKKQYLEFYLEWKQSGEEMIPWVITKNPSDFESMVQFLIQNELGINLPVGWVPDSTFWLINEDQKILGVVNIRHRLTEKLLNNGGHMGYGIRPSERRKGYASKLLELSLEKAKQFQITNVLVVCDEDNIGSLKTILKNGGVQDWNFTEENGNIVKRFWINLNN